MCILADCEEFSLRSFRQVAERQYRILYTGNDLRLLEYLQERLKDCFVVRAPNGYAARVFIKGETDYSLFLFDAELPDATGVELESFTRMQHQSAPVHIIQASDNFSAIVKTGTRSLSHS